MEVATTALGQLRGVRTAGITAWLGVPYARPPVGALRFRAPQPAAPWTGVRDATRFAPAAPQLATDSPVAEPMVKKCGQSEDCLYLNVWSPAPDSARRPVLVWLHGGAFMMGTGATYDGAAFAAMADIVVVTLNYRLGVLGFCGFGGLWRDAGFDDNVGLLDQRAALAWVYEHVAAFGGDPDRVTIAGESAGSVSVALHLLDEAPRFRGAIAQSGAMSLASSAERGLEHARMYADAFGVTAATAERLRELPVERLTAVHQQVMLANLGAVTTRPYLDGRVLPATGAELFARPTARVPLLAGSNRDEATLFALLQLLPTDRAQLETRVRAQVPAERADAILAVYPPDRAGALHLARDAVFGMPMIHLAERHRAPTWMYRFDWPTPAFGGQLGAMHALEVFLMWMDPERRGVQMVLGGPPGAEVRALADRMKRAWLAFVRDGDPGPDWPRYAPPTRTTRLFDVADQLVDDLERERREAWDGIDSLDA